MRTGVCAGGPCATHKIDGGAPRFATHWASARMPQLPTRLMSAQMPQCSQWQCGDCQRGCRIATKWHRGRQHRCRNCGAGCPRGCRIAEAPWVNAAAAMQQAGSGL
eukprot:5944472-Alexandrium_andersonii.AAC.1